MSEVPKRANPQLSARKAHPLFGFFFNIVFPTTSLTNIMVFLFLCAVLAYSLALQWILSPSFALDVSGTHDYGVWEPFFTTAGALFILVPITGLTFCFVMFASGIWKNDNAGPALTLPGFSIIIYMLVVLGQLYVSKDDSWYPILLIYGIMFMLPISVAIAKKAVAFGLVNSRGSPFNRIDFAIGALASGGAVLYYLLEKGSDIFQACIAGYAFFIASMIVYRLIKDLVAGFIKVSKH